VIWWSESGRLRLDSWGEVWIHEPGNEPYELRLLGHIDTARVPDDQDDALAELRGAWNRERYDYRAQVTSDYFSDRYPTR
jgi:hypothetical protein